MTQNRKVGSLWELSPGTVNCIFLSGSAADVVPFVRAVQSQSSRQTTGFLGAAGLNVREAVHF